MGTRCYINAAASVNPNQTMDGQGYMQASEPDYKELITDPNMRRRMSRIVKMGVYAGLQCIQQNPSAGIDAIATATGLGCLTDTEKFLEQLIERNEQQLNPTAFIQSTFNVIGAQLALITKNTAYNNTYAHRGLSFESALLDAMLCIYDGASNVLVGAADEATPTLYKVLSRMGLLKGLTLGEGAQFFTLSARRNGETLAELKAVKTFSGKCDGATIAESARLLLQEQQVQIENLSLLMLGRTGNHRYDRIYNDLEQLLTSASICMFKDTCGEYQTASAFGLWRSVDLLRSMKNGANVLVCNSYNGVNHSLILLGK